MTAKNYSLRLHLMRLISVPIIVAGLVIGGLALAFTYYEIDEVYDAQLAQSAKLLMKLTQQQLEEDIKRGVAISNENPDFTHLYEKKISFRIWWKNQLVTESASAGIFGDKPAPLDFSTRPAAGSTWRLFSIADDDDDLLVEVAENQGIRTELILQILSSLFIPGLVFLPVMLGFVWYGTTRSLRPMKTLAQQVNGRGAQDLKPFETEKISREILPFIGALNRLFLRVDRSLQREKEFTDNAAHELRTPLAAMKTQTQVLIKKAGAMPACREDLENLLTSIDRAAHLVDQLLLFARLQNMDLATAPVDLTVLAENVSRQMYPRATGRHHRLEVNVEQGLVIEGSASALAILIGNLVENAIKYTPPNGHIAVDLLRREGAIALIVSDDGPGIPSELHEKVFDRFYRINKDGTAGSGLGLAMVKWIADMHYATIELARHEPKGLTITIMFRSSQ